MKRYITILLAAVSIHGVVTAQNNVRKILGTTVDIQDLEYHADSVRVNMEFDFDELNIGVNESAIFTPKIYKDGNKIELPTMVVKRRGGAKSYNRAMALGNEKSIEMYDELYGTPYQVIEYFGGDKTSSAQYSLSIPYQTWMVESQLYVDCNTYGCCNKEHSGVLIPEDNVLMIDTPNVASYNVMPSVSLVKPEKVAIKRRDIQYSSALIFRVNSTYIDPKLGDNSAELASIDTMMQSVLSDSDYTITKINIIGFASPEGTLATNMRLSEGRAKALERLIENKYKAILANDLYNVEFGGENWGKLYELVEQSDIKDRDEILRIIRDIPLDEGREAKLMSLNGGATYKYLLVNVFPATRLVVVDVEFNVDAYDIERIKDVINTKPQNLSLEEMYRLSELYDVNDPEFEKIFQTAIGVYPNDEVALNNALVTEIMRSNISSLDHLVERINENTESADLANSLGAYYMLLGNYDKAKIMLKRAAELGSSRAIENLEQLSTKLENIRQIQESEAFKAKIYGK